MSTPTPGAGWYPDPHTGQQRYFDGTNWGPTAPPPAASTITDPPKKSSSGRTVVGIVVALVFLLVLISKCSSKDDDRQSGSTSSRTTSSTAFRAPTSTVPPGPSPQDLDPATYAPISARDFAILVKNPDGEIGRKIIVYGVVTQFDAATGGADFRVNTGSSPGDSSDYDQNTIVHAEDSAIVANVVEKDLVTMYVEVSGSMTYDTTMGGSMTAPKFTVYIVEVTGSDG